MEDQTGFNLRDTAYQKSIKELTQNYEKKKKEYVVKQRSQLVGVKSKAELNAHLDNISKNYDLQHKARLDEQKKTFEEYHFKDVGGSRATALQRMQAYEKQIQGELPKLSEEFNKENKLSKNKSESERSFDERLLSRHRKRKNHDRSRGR